MYGSYTSCVLKCIIIREKVFKRHVRKSDLRIKGTHMIEFYDTFILNSLYTNIIMSMIHFLQIIERLYCLIKDINVFFDHITSERRAS